MQKKKLNKKTKGACSSPISMVKTDKTILRKSPNSFAVKKQKLHGEITNKNTFASS